MRSSFVASTKRDLNRGEGARQRWYLDIVIILRKMRESVLHMVDFVPFGNLRNVKVKFVETFPSVLKCKLLFLTLHRCAVKH
jgi:hypothetical protein